MGDLVLHGMSDDLLAALHARADRNRRTVDQEAACLLRDSLAHEDNARASAVSELLSLAGSWKDTRSAEEIIESIRASRQPGTRPTVSFDVSD